MLREMGRKPPRCVVLQYIHRSREIFAKERHTGGYFHRAAAADREMLVFKTLSCVFSFIAVVVTQISEPRYLRGYNKCQEKEGREEKKKRIK